jgi:prefoldin alpha subunit
MSEEKLTQQQVQALSDRFQQFQYQAESIAQQLNVLQITIRDLETALTTITALKDEPAGKETLVPIGFGSFVNATLTNPDKVVIGIGAGVSVEKKIDDAKALLEKRKVELTKYQEQMNTTLEKITSEMQNIQKIAQKHQQTQQPLHAE